MKSWTKLAGCGAAAMLVLLASCGGGKKDAAVDKPVKATESFKPADAAAPARESAALKPGEAAAKQAPFSAEMSAEFMKKVMETSARIDAVKKQIANRQAVIFETNPEVKAYRAQLVDMQGQIAKIMDADAELAALKLDRDILWTTMPTFPRAGPPGGQPRGFGPMK